MEGIFLEISAIIVVSTALALLAKVLKQPVILAYIVTGIILGPLGIDIIKSHELIDAVSTFGVAFLLFLIGIELDLKKFKELNKVVLISGFGQVFITGAVTYGISWLLGFNQIQCWFIAVALTFSSTIITVKLLSEKRQMQSLYGRITIAILIVQDFLAIIALLLLESFGANFASQSIPWDSLGIILIKTLGLAALAFILAKYVFKRIFTFIGQSKELLFLWSIAWCLLFAALSIYLHFSVAIGVFFAGIALASLEYNFEIAARIRPLRDFFIVFFFTYLGSQLLLSIDTKLIITTIILSLYVLIGNPLIVFMILSIYGYNKRTALFTGLAIGQISEFSFIIANIGLKQGHLSHDTVSMIALVGLITITFSTYVITYNEKIFHILQPILKIWPWPKTDKENTTTLSEQLTNHIVVFGYHPPVNKILDELRKFKKEILVVDYNPRNTHLIKKQNVHYLYGDMRDEDILEQANIEQALMVISIVPYIESTMAVLQYIKHFKIQVDVIVSATNLFDTERCYEAGATFVLHPESISLDYLKKILSKEELVKVSALHKKEIVTLLKDLDDIY